MCVYTAVQTDPLNLVLMQCEQILYAQFYDSSMKRPMNTIPCFFITEKLRVSHQFPKIADSRKSLLIYL